MKRLIPSSLSNPGGTGFWQTNPNSIKSDLFIIGPTPNGQTICIAENQWDITVPAGTGGWTGSTQLFSSTAYGRWSRGAITSEAGFSLASNSMELTCVAQPGTQFPGLELGVLQAAWRGLFDAVPIIVYTAYMPIGQYGNVSAGLETKWGGFIESVKEIDRAHVMFECQDPLYLLNQKIPARIIQAGCPWGFCDANCTLNPADYTITFTATTGSTSSLLVPSSAFSQATGYFSQGVVTCLTGGNAGLSTTVKIHDSDGNLELSLPFILPVMSGDTFSVIKGCDKSVSMCSNTVQAGGGTVNNLVNFGGEPDVPQPLQAV